MMSEPLLSIYGVLLAGGLIGAIWLFIAVLDWMDGAWHGKDVSEYKPYEEDSAEVDGIVFPEEPRDDWYDDWSLPGEPPPDYPTNHPHGHNVKPW